MPTNQRNPRVQGLQHRDRVQHQLQTVFDGVNSESELNVLLRKIKIPQGFCFSKKLLNIRVYRFWFLLIFT